MSDLEQIFEEVLKESNYQHLQEQLIDAKLEELEKAMEDDRELGKFLNMKGKDFENSKDENYRKYLLLIQELTDDYREKSLLDIIKDSLSYKVYYGQKLVSKFSRNNNGKLIGFAAYLAEEDIVKQIKIFSFNPIKEDQTFPKDLIGLIKELRMKYHKIHWSARKESKRNRRYRDIVKMFNGPEPIEKDNILYYQIDGCI
jgi:hypothetical protein